MRTLTQLNPYYRPLQEGFRQFVLLNGVLFQFSTHVNHRSAEIEAGLKRRRRRTPYVAAAALVIMDLTAVQADGWPVVFPIGGHLRKGRGYLTALRDISSRESAWTVAQGFERFQAFAKDAAALFLRRNPLQLAAPAWRKRRRKAGSDDPTTRHLRDFREFVDRAYGGANDLVKRLSASLPELARAESHNHRGVALPHWLGAVAAVRHATVHNSAVLSLLQLDKCGPDQVKILRKGFPGKSTSRGYELKLNAKVAEETLKVFAEYSFLIYKALSRLESLDEQVYRQG